MTPNKPTTLRESLLQEFDEKFGKPQFDEDGELFLECSIGRSAGCDDCFTNQKERAEHREFLEKVLTSHSTELVSKIEGMRKVADENWGLNEDDSAYNQALDEVISLINQEK